MRFGENSAKYELVSTSEIDHEEDHANLLPQTDLSSGTGDAFEGERIRATVLHGDGFVPITRVPLTGRDITYSILFLCHFGVIFGLSTIDKLDVEDSFIRHSSEALWTSMVLTVTILGFFVGALVVFLLLNSESREFLVSVSIPFAIFIQICLGNIILQFQLSLSSLGILVLAGAIAGFYQYKALMKDVSFNCAVVGFVSDVIGQFGFSLVLACVAIAFAQTCILLWWGVFLVDFIGDVPSQYLQYVIALMLFSLFWIMQYFHAFMSYVVGGCFVWYFLKDENAPLEPSKRVMLHVQGALLSNFGSLCKGGLVCPIGVALSHLTSIRLCSCCASWMDSLARSYSRLGFCLCASYGLTFSRATSEYQARYPLAMQLLRRDSCRLTLSTLPIELAGLISIFFGVFSARKEPQHTQLLFIVLIFVFSYCGISIAVTVFQSATDALFAVFSLNPERLAKENQLIFLRLLRAYEEELA